MKEGDDLRKKRKRRIFFYSLLIILGALFASQTITSAVTRPLRYYTDSNGTAMTYFTNLNNNTTISAWGINTDNPLCELDINGTICINRTGFYFNGVNISGTGSATDNYTTSASVVLSGTGRTLNLKQAIGNNITASWTETSSNGTGTVTSVVGGNGLLGGNITTFGTLQVDADNASSNQYSYWNGSRFLVRADQGTTYTGSNGVAVYGTNIIANATVCSGNEVSTFNNTTFNCVNVTSSLTLDQIAANIGNYSGNASALYTNITALQTFRNAIYINVTDLQNSNASTNTRINTLNTSIDNLYVNVTNLQSSNTSTNTRINTINTTVQNLLTSNTTTTTTINNLYVNVTNLQSSNTSTNTRIDTLNTSLQTKFDTARYGLNSSGITIGVNAPTLIANQALGYNASNWTIVFVGNLTASNGTAGYPCVFTNATNCAAQLIATSMHTLSSINSSLLNTTNTGTSGQALTLNSNLNQFTWSSIILQSAFDALYTNVTNLQTSNTSIYQSLASINTTAVAAADPGNCVGSNSTHINVTQNTTTNGVQCVAVALNPGSGSAYTSSNGISLYGTNFVANATICGGGQVSTFNGTTYNCVNTTNTGSLSDLLTDVNNTGTTETQLYNYTIPANTLTVNGDKLVGVTSGTFVASGTATRDLKVYLNGTKIFDSSGLTTAIAAGWSLSYLISMDSTITARASVTLTSGISSGTNYTAVTTVNWSSTNIFNITGTAAGVGAATGDITAKVGYITKGEFGNATSSSGGSGSNNVSVQDEGVTTITNVTVWNFVGSAVTVTNVSNVATINITAGAGAGNVTSTNGVINYLAKFLNATAIAISNLWENGSQLNISVDTYLGTTFTNNSSIYNDNSGNLHINTSTDAIFNGEISANGYFMPNGMTDYFEVIRNDYVSSVGFGMLGGVAVASGTAAAGTATLKHPGVVAIRDSTTANGGYRIGTDNATWIINGTENSTFIFNAPGGKAGTTIGRLGFFDLNTVFYTPSDGCWLQINTTAPPVTGSNIYGQCANNTLVVNTTTNYTFTNNTWYKGNIFIDTNALNVNFSLYNDSGSLLWSSNLTTNIPVITGRETGWGVMATQNTSDAASDIFYMDFSSFAYSKVIDRP